MADSIASFILVNFWKSVKVDGEIHLEGAAFGGNDELARDTSEGEFTSLEFVELDLEDFDVGICE